MRAMQVYLVGGAVRDRLLGLPVRERDWVVVGATPERARARGLHAASAAISRYSCIRRPSEEHALARTERKVGPRLSRLHHRSSRRDVTLEDDLRRRDLTINAIAEDERGELIDPYGGQRDLEARVLRHVSDAFVEDPVRILRVARFAARYAQLGFTVARETLALMRRWSRPARSTRPGARARLAGNRERARREPARTSSSRRCATAAR